MKPVNVEKVTNKSELNRSRKHARVAVREAFVIAGRQLREYARRHRGAANAVPLTRGHA